MALFFAVAGSFLLGVCSAWIARAFLAHPLPIAGDWFVLRHAENPGIAFGVRIPSPWQEILILAALVVVSVVAFRTRTTFARIAYGMIVGGALANVVDRIADGTVTDYFAVGAFPVFNVPDACISIGVALLLAESIGIGRIIRRKT